ncbi:TPA: thiol:disulfide interchange protein, partial [Mannheimia haemolytica]|nr:thiol:disulfide interchange protein [Mannheimia haemolytica]
MKKLALKTAFVALSALFTFNSTAIAADPTAGKEYIEVRKAPSAQKEVVEFFSFYCPHCYDFELSYKIPSQIKEKLPSDSKLVQYHV